VPAGTEDVALGRATRVGERIHRMQPQEPSAVFFEQVARRDPADPNSPKVGLGRFHAEIWVMSWLGIDFQHFSKAQLVAARFYFDALFPFLLLFLFSMFSRPVAKRDLDRFFARLRTPVQKTPELDKLALAEAMEHPESSEQDKIFPHSQWEIYRPGWMDALGFGGSWLLVLVILFLLWLMVNLR
jgi:SSS family solute:Na+ symporter